MRTLRRSAAKLIAVVLVALFPHTSMSQTVGPQASSGLGPYQAFAGTRENINLATGNLNLQIPLLSLPGRNGHDLSLTLEYDSKIWIPSAEYDPDSGQYLYYWNYDTSGFFVGTLGWRLNIPVLTSTIVMPYSNNSSYQCQGGYLLTTGDGSKHAFFADGAPQMGPRTNCVFYSPSGTVQEPQLDINTGSASDSSYVLLDVTNPSDIVARAKDGTAIHFGNYAGGSATKIEDANGNIINFSNPLVTITDSIGRSITVTSGLTYKDSTGTQRTISLSLTNFSLAPCFQNPVAGCLNNPPTSANLITSITLPNNLTYSFQYNNFGELTKITYPTGGYTRYDYGVYTNLVMSLSSPAFPADFREATAKHVCRLATGNCSPSTTPEDTTTYTPTVDGTKTNNQYMDVLSPLGDRTRHQFSYQISGTLSTTYSFRELFRYDYQGQSALLKTVQTDYNNLDSNGTTTNASLPIRETVRLNDVSPALMKKTEWDYTGVADQVSEERDYDFGSGAVGALIRRKDYTWLGVNPVNGQDYTATSIHMLNRKASEQIKDSSGNVIAQTQYEYDNYASDSKHAPLQASGAVQHDSSFNSNYTVRGNLTATQHWRNTDSTWLTTYNQFDDAGNVLKTIDPLSHATSFGFADSWNDATCAPTGGKAAAYLTSVTNALNQTATSKFNSCSGSTASTTDPNGQTVSNSYDAMARLTQTSLPDGGQITRTFNEASLPRGISTTVKLTSSSNTVGTSNVDGLGRVVQPQLNSDPQGPAYTDTAYDALERTSTVSNPYRSTSESTYGLTTYQYDALGRVIKVIPPDGTSTSNNVSTTYAGNCSTTTDQAAKARKACKDALGRMTQVFEPNSSGSFVNETDYQYDVLGNLLCVHQRGTDITADKPCSDPTVPASWRPRKFSYNSLSELLTATNPESGTITYTYDNDGNVLTKTDARNITTTLYYDALHRVTKKTFSDSTPQVTYWYDGQTPTGCSPTLTATNPVGRRTAMCDADGWEAWSYDSIGRVLTERRNTNGITKDTIYTYNLDGSLATAAYPSGRTITYTVNAVGRAISATDVANGINYATNATYSAFGSLVSLQNGATLYSTFLFNTRLQPCWLYINTSSVGAPTTCTQTGLGPAAVLDLQYNFGLGVNDNGNVRGFTNNRNTARSQTFTFDELNRLKTALTQGTSGSLCFGLDYSYDIWGNLTTTSLDPARSSCSWTALSVGLNNNNQITNTGFSYDAAGNVSADGSFNYTWDAESQLKTAAGVTYAYDGDGRRVQKSNGKLYWYGAGGEILDETDASGNLTSEYIYFGGKRIARRDSSNNVFYYFADYLGSSRVIAQANGTVCYDADYDPFGKEVVVTNTCPQNYKFNGKERDAETNLDDFGARYYSSQFGRWITPDWSAAPSAVPYASLLNPQTLNLYAYVRNNPVTFADLDGHMIAQDTMDRSGSDLGMGIGHWSPLGPNDQDTGRELDPTDYSGGQLRVVTHATPMSDGSIFTEVRLEFSPYASQAQNQSTQQQTTTSPQCEAQMRSRPGDATAAWGYGASHAWWYVVDDSGQDHTLSFTMNMTLKGPYLNAYAANGSQSSSNANDNLTHGSVIFDVKGASVCAGVAKMIQATKDFPHRSVRYGPLKGEATSNSGARYLGAVGGFKPPMPSQPGLRAVGWDRRIPGVE